MLFKECPTNWPVEPYRSPAPWRAKQGLWIPSLKVQTRLGKKQQQPYQIVRLSVTNSGERFLRGDFDKMQEAGTRNEIAGAKATIPAV